MKKWGKEEVRIARTTLHLVDCLAAFSEPRQDSLVRMGAVEMVCCGPVWKDGKHADCVYILAS